MERFLKSEYNKLDTQDEKVAYLHSHKVIADNLDGLPRKEKEFAKAVMKGMNTRIAEPEAEVEEADVIVAEPTVENPSKDEKPKEDGMLKKFSKKLGKKK